MARRPKGEQGFDTRTTLECFAVDLARWDAAAETAGQSRAEWMRRALNAAAVSRREKWTPRQQRRA